MEIPIDLLELLSSREDSVSRNVLECLGSGVVSITRVRDDIYCVFCNRGEFEATAEWLDSLGWKYPVS